MWLNAFSSHCLSIFIVVFLGIASSAIFSSETRAIDGKDKSTESLVFDVDELKWINKAETYLNRIKSMQSEFFQTAAGENSASGVFYLRRPGRLRIEYSPPSKVLIVGDGLFLHFHDRELGQINDWPIFDTPLGILSSKNFRFNERLIITDVSRQSGILSISTVKKGDEELGQLILYFTEAPMELKRWKIVDGEESWITVTLFNSETNVDLDNKLFVFDDPREQNFKR